MKALSHLRTINHHKWLVMKGCFRVGLYRQGLMHDMSKYGPTELLVGFKYYGGTESPHNQERREKGYSTAWLHHKGRNKHHIEYWTDFGLEKGKGIVGMKMPVKYVAEMFIDRMSASKVYKKDAYTDASPWEYYENGRCYHVLHPDTRDLLESLLLKLKDEGEEAVFAYIRHTVLKIDFKY